MAERRPARINLLPSGIPGMDILLGGGLVEFSFNLIAGAPGAGKTTAAQQILFTNATEERPAVYFTILGEPQLKMLRYQQQFSFFDADKFGRSVHFHNLSHHVLTGGLEAVLDEITAEVERTRPAIIAVDSFRSVIRTIQDSDQPEPRLQTFIQQLALRLTSWEVTSFLIGEYVPSEVRENPVFTVADGIFWFSQAVEQNAVVRKLQVIKSRGQAPTPGLHTFRITDNGIHIFPRTTQGLRDPDDTAALRANGTRLNTGSPELDAMLHGGIPAGDSVLIAGPAGSGKTALGSQFIAAGAAAGEAGVIACFEEHPETYLDRTEKLGIDLRGPLEAGTLRILYLPVLDLSVDEALQNVRDAVQEIGATRVVIDSLSGFEIALAPGFRDEFRESLYRMLAALTHRGVTVMLTVEVSDDYTSLRFSPHAVSFMIDDLIVQRYVELDGGIHRVLTIVKMRGSAHSRDWRSYEIGLGGIQVGAALQEYRGIVTGVPVRREPDPAYHSRLSAAEVAVLHSVSATVAADLDHILQQTGLDESTLRSALNRLAQLGYLTASEREGTMIYQETDASHS